MTPEVTGGSTISVSVTPTFGDYLRFNWWAIFRRIWFLIPFAVLSLVVFLASPLLPLPGETALAKYQGAIMGLFLPVMVFLFLPATIYLGARQRWQQAPDLRESRTYSFSDSGIQVKSGGGEGFTTWQYITSADRVGGQFILGSTQPIFYLIPLRAFAAAEEVERFTRLLRAKISGCRL
jgi:hypothetical protein